MTRSNNETAEPISPILWRHRNPAKDKTPRRLPACSVRASSIIGISAALTTADLPMDVLDQPVDPAGRCIRLKLNLDVSSDEDVVFYRRTRYRESSSIIGQVALTNCRCLGHSNPDNR